MSMTNRGVLCLDLGGNSVLFLDSFADGTVLSKYLRDLNSMISS